MNPQTLPPFRPQLRAFTLLELLSVIVIIAILAVLAIPAFDTVKLRLEKVHCISNLKSLYVAANTYVQDNHHWPQINPMLVKSAPNEYAKGWIDALTPYHVAKQSWICPTMQRVFGNPDYLKPGAERVDYFATPFDTLAFTPHKWNSQPWFAERGDMHGNGNLLIMSDGSIHELKEFMKK
jgi:prepilin-type N-terminal cleavage/methylation domain-containing protein